MGTNQQDDIPQLCADLISACAEARTIQTRFLVEHARMSWRTARNLPQAERDALQAEYSRWLANQAS